MSAIANTALKEAATAEYERLDRWLKDSVHKSSMAEAASTFVPASAETEPMSSLEALMQRQDRMLEECA